MTATLCPGVEWWPRSREPFWCDQSGCDSDGSVVAHHSAPSLIETPCETLALTLRRVDLLDETPDSAMTVAHEGEPHLKLVVVGGAAPVVVLLDLQETAGLILALARELARASGAPKVWRRARLGAIKRHVHRMLDYLTEGDPAYWAHREKRAAVATARLAQGGHRPC